MLALPGPSSKIHVTRMNSSCSVNQPPLGLRLPLNRLWENSWAVLVGDAVGKTMWGCRWWAVMAQVRWGRDSNILPWNNVRGRWGGEFHMQRKPRELSTSVQLVRIIGRGKSIHLQLWHTSVDKLTRTTYLKFLDRPSRTRIDVLATRSFYSSTRDIRWWLGWSHPKSYPTTSGKCRKLSCWWEHIDSWLQYSTKPSHQKIIQEAKETEKSQ